MAKTLELALVHSAGTFVFSVEGEYFPRWEPTYRFNIDPPEVVELRLAWEFRQVKLVAATPAALFAGAGATIATLAGLLGTRGLGFPTNATLKNSGGTTLLEFGATYEQFIIEVLEGEADAETPRSSWATSAAFTLRLSAIKKNGDARSIVDFQQTVRVSYPGGLHRLSVETLITTKEGTSAVTKAGLYATLDSTAYGSDYLYETGIGSDGIDYDYDDADLVNSRTPTVCRAVSTIQRKGVDVGTTGPSGSLADASYSIDTQRTAKEVIVTTTAEAIGANAMSWVLSLKPGGSLFDSRIFEERASRLVRGTWVKRTQRTTADGETTVEAVVEITGGGPALSYEPVAGGFEPLEFEGAFLPWAARVTVTVERVGGSGRLSELRLPGPPGDPWRFDQNASTEQDPFRVQTEKGTDDAQDRWKREAVLVFRSVRPPDGPVAVALAAAPPIATYFYPQVT